MLDTFYIVGKNTPVSGMWYKLLLKDTHFCISCGGDLDKILQVLKTYVKRYRTRTKLLSALSKLDYNKVSPATFAQAEKEFKSCGDYYKDLVTDTVEQALRELREEDKVNSPLNKAKRRLGKGNVAKTTSPVTEEKEVVKTMTTPKTLVKRPVVIRNK